MYETPSRSNFTARCEWASVKTEVEALAVELRKYVMEERVEVRKIDSTAGGNH